MGNPPINNNDWSGSYGNTSSTGDGSFPQQSTIDPKAIASLMAVLQTANQNNQPAMSMVGSNGQPAIGNANGQQLPPQAQKSAQKALQQYYDAHAQQALTQPDGVRALTAIANGQQTIQNTQPTQNTPEQNVANIGQQAAQLVSPQQGGFHPLEALLNFVKNDMTPFGITQSVMQNKNLQNLGAAQKISAGQPSEIVKPQAEAAQAYESAKSTQAELTAGKPQADVDLVKQQTQSLQKEWENKAKEINAGVYATQNERQNKIRESLMNVRKQVIDQMTSDLEKGPILNRGKRLDLYRQQLDYYDNKIKGLDSKQEGAVYKDKNGNMATYKNGKYVPIGG